MNDEQRLQLIQRVRTLVKTAKDNVLFTQSGDKGKAIDRLNVAMDILNNLTDDYMFGLCTVTQIYVSEDTVINNETTVEVPTSITGTREVTDASVFFFEGFIPSEGPLRPRAEYTEDGIKVFIENTIPQSVNDAYDLCVSPYNDKGDIFNFHAGEFMLKKGEVIGCKIKSTKSKETPKVKEKV